MPTEPFFELLWGFAAILFEFLEVETVGRRCILQNTGEACLCVGLLQLNVHRREE